MAQRKKTEGFNLAFLDIMSCGLGAVVLVFMLVKHNISTGNEVSSEVDKLTTDIQQLEQARDEAQQALEKARQQVDAEKLQQQDQQSKLAAIESLLATQKQSVDKTASEIDALKSSIKDIKVNKQADMVESKVVYEENYLLGLKVEGPRIAILVDASASMTHEKLIDIIKTKNGTKAEKQQAAKWLRTKRIVEWLLARVPSSSDIIVVAFNEKASALGNKKWSRANDSDKIKAIIADLNKLVPEGATNLQIGLQTINKFAPSNIYIITDGLPTKGESRYKSLNPFASCGSLSGTANTITGECRVKLFRQTVIESNLPSAVVNTVLLPIEGDPAAVNEFWYWTSSSGGLLISPAGNWP